MPYKEKEITKLYYSISEVAAMFKVNASLIRFWEKEFDIIKPKKNKKGNRLFTNDDIENFKHIFHLVKDRGYTLDGAKKEIKGERKAHNEQNEILKKLQKIKKTLLEMKEEL
jgi:DNA-binding transcriptional MerR regulator